jgi:hypothetical protein
MYGLKPPRFCGGCGKETSIAGAGEVAEKSRPERKVVRESKYEDFDPDGLDIFTVPSISKLSYSVEHDSRIKLNLEDLVDIEEFQEFIEGDEVRPKPKSENKRKTAHGKQKDK